MKNPIENNRLVKDMTFATRFLRFAEGYETSGPCDSDEKKSMISYAKQLLLHQQLTVKSSLEKDYLKRVGHLEPEVLFTTNDGFQKYTFPFTLYGVTKDPQDSGRGITNVSIKRQIDIDRMNKNKILFHHLSSAEFYLEDNEKRFSINDINKLLAHLNEHQDSLTYEMIKTKLFNTK